ncbi:Holliday junction branch migration protein RuvA [Suttonella sp. R2A3]|uniref:Holliday junction branch migration protein RuvA n=1 Tax=Suttonella sp. R2A3 TaxID=2908648 RepID=UPI001F3AFA0E|nr:Holliday junction branch migration protein RuvA [Suttonella sp. R2A3]UJF24478.1 Holliday junction branch migration protein RuvA [Suttonella sp. R2A3]
MIGYLRGQVLVKQGNTLIVETGGVGYEVSVPVSVIEQVSQGSESALFIHHNVREDGHYLFGFIDLAQRQLFRELIRVSGIGPKMALLILSGFSVDSFVRLVREQNSAALVKLPGVGKKTAERLLIELHDRVGKTFAGVGEDTSVDQPGHDAAVETEEALVALGYKPAAAAKMVDQARRALGDGVHSTDQLLREVLKSHVPRGL